MFGVFVLALISFGVAILFIIISEKIGPKHPSKIKDYPFECGHIIETDASFRKHSVGFYMTAIVFLLFDIEIVFLYPWAKIFRKIGLMGLIEVVIFILILIFGYIYIWKKGVLEWD